MINLNELLQLLLKNKIDFVVVGEYAGLLHGETCEPKALEIALMMSPTNLQNLRRILTPYHPKHRDNPKQKYSFIDVPENLRGWKSFYLETDLGLLDLLGDVKRIGSFSRIRERAVSIEVGAYSCIVMSKDDLKISRG